jgi:hypothetical protein
VLADVLAHLDRRHRVERLVRDLAVVLQPDLDAVREAERATRASPYARCWTESVTPVARTP